MKKALLTLALLVVPFFSLADIFENAQGSVEAKMATSCDWEKTPQEAVAEFNTINNRPTQTDSLKQDAATLSGTTVSNTDTYCEMRVSFTWDEYKYSSSAGWYFYRKKSGSVLVYGSYGEAPTCDNLGNNSDGSFTYPDHTVLNVDENGAGRCYTPQSLADADTCEQKDSDGLYESFIASESGYSCMEKSEDGSICPVKKNFEITSNTTGNTSYFYEYDTSADPSSCYKQNTVEPPQPDELIKDSTFPSNVGECSESNGISMCKESPLNVCDSNGNCNAGCGSIGFGGQNEFVCLSGDIDNDSIPDYQDRDKDGDGIINEDDLDADGDGIEDPINNAQSKVRTPHQSSIEQLLSQIAQNTSGGSGGGGSGASASQIGESVAEELEEKLVEQADFSGTEFEQSINSKIEATNTSIDEFLQDDEKDLTNAFDESEFESSFSSLKSALSPNGCSAQFGIPFTNSNLDLCEPASKAQPFLYVIFAISTFIYCMRRIQSTARSE